MPSPPYILRHGPLLTPRINFVVAPLPPLPVLTTRIEFTLDRLSKTDQQSDDNDNPNNINGPSPESSSSSSTGDKRPAPETQDLDLRPLKKGRVTGGSPAPHGSEGADSAEPHAGEQVSTPMQSSGPSRKIPQPRGEPGKPGGGGYSLDEIIMESHKWPQDDFDELIAAVKAEALESLECDMSYSKQNKMQVDMVCQKIQSRWPILVNYAKCWPVHSALKLCLKSTSEAARHNQKKAQLEGMEALMSQR